ncbi:mannose-6-phosphate isomerase, class I [Romboutsia weinsteinii]|uniref:mannose-6-phosphate isomerase n=1 Tax=Romboutsia weinsteinii TaxID=2020949 RepID=A0A371J8T5_9FIRM|nr:mannose-6-phosphate isomerase, class I [Romboutsia weinsteinii]RDY29169.1 mannose-6-phosphate isomerase, class I [Romboutsia weinsteinii]
MQPLFLKPILMDKIWGGDSLKTKFNYDIPTNTTGECWGISAHPNGDSEITNGDYKGKTLSYLWENHRELFGNMKGEKFPLLTKVLDANDNLSVQVHPDDEYAQVHENGELGKTECWYVIDCAEDADMIIGHNASSKEELEEMIKNNEWDKLLRSIKIKKGDFFYVPSGTIHALCKGTLILETQQNSDTTYRVYDYDRKDDNGNPRELHVEKSIAVSTTPHKETNEEFKISKGENFTCTTYISNEFFSVYKLDIEGKAEFNHDQPFSLYSIIEGSGSITVEEENTTFELKKGDHFILPHNLAKFTFGGEMEIIASHM